MQPCFFQDGRDMMITSAAAGWQEYGSRIAAGNKASGNARGRKPYPLKKQGLSALHVSKKMHGKPKKCLTGLWTRYIIIVVPQSCFYGHDTMIRTIFY